MFNNDLGGFIRLVVAAFIVVVVVFFTWQWLGGL